MFYDEPPVIYEVPTYAAEISAMQAAMEADGITDAEIGASRSDGGYPCLPLVCRRYSVVLTDDIAESVALVKAAAVKLALEIEAQAAVKAAIMAGTHAACQRAADMAAWFLNRGISRTLDDIADDVAWAVVRGE